MAATYDPPPASGWVTVPKDHVRHLLGDVASPFQFLDAEIVAQLIQETASGTAKDYYAAASLLDTLMLKWLGKGRGISEKEVDDLKLKFGLGERGTAAEAITAQIVRLRSEGARRLQPAPYVFRTLRTHS